jgi:hypothetical protein
VLRTLFIPLRLIRHGCMQELRASCASVFYSTHATKFFVLASAARALCFAAGAAGRCLIGGRQRAGPFQTRSPLRSLFAFCVMLIFRKALGAMHHSFVDSVIINLFGNKHSDRMPERST